MSSLHSLQLLPDGLLDQRFESYHEELLLLLLLNGKSRARTTDNEPRSDSGALLQKRKF